METSAYLSMIALLSVLCLFVHFLGYKYNLFSYTKVEYLKQRYPFIAGLLTLLTLFCYMFSPSFLPWYFTIGALVVFFLFSNKTLFLTLFKDRHSLPKTSVWWDALIGFVLFIAAYPMLSLVNNILEFVFVYFFQLPVPEQNYIEFIKQIRSDTFLFISLFFMGSVFVPLLEEFIYRANIQTWLKNWFKPTTAIILTSIFFGFSHFFTIDTFQGKFVAIALTGVASLYLGFGYERQRSLITSIVFHGCLNAQTFLLAYFAA